MSVAMGKFSSNFRAEANALKITVKGVEETKLFFLTDNMSVITALMARRNKEGSEL